MPFEPGNRLAAGGARAGAGRKSDALKAELRALIDQAVPEAHWIAIFQMLATRARAGDERAASLLLDRKFGKATQVIEIDEPDEAPVDVAAIPQSDLETIARILRAAAAAGTPPEAPSADHQPAPEPASGGGGAEAAPVPA